MIELLFLVLTTPILQYILIQTNTGKLIYGGIPFSLCFFAPFYYRYHATFYLATYCCFLMYNYLRILDISLLPKSTVRSWSINEYFEYFFGYYTKTQRKEMGEECFSKNAVPYAKRTAGYYGRLAWTLLVQYVIVSALVWYSKTYPPNRDLPVNTFLWPFELKKVVDNLVFGLTICLILKISIYFLT